MLVTKRDGRIMEFNKERIVNAIVKAMMQTTDGVDIELANKIALSIEKWLENKEQITVYEIQDLVEKKLMGSSRKDVATAYITYRYNRDIARRSKTREVFLDIISAKSNLNSKITTDSNVSTPSIIMSKFASEIAKPYVDSFLVTKDAREAERKGYIHIGNKNYYLAKSLKSFQLSLNNIVLAEENIEAIVNKLYITVNELKNELDGMISIPALDFYFAPFVKNTYFEEIEKIGEDLNIGIENLKNNVLKDYEYQEISELSSNDRIVQIAVNRTIYRVYSSIKRFIENLISSHKEKDTIFCSINFGTDISPEGRLVINELLEIISEKANEEKNNLPILIWKKKSGINYLRQDKNYDLFLDVLELIQDRNYINVINLDAPFNENAKWKKNDEKRFYYECALIGGSRVFENINGNKTSIDRGTLSSVIINLPKIAIESFDNVRKDLNMNVDIERFENIPNKFKTKLKKEFVKELEKYTDISLLQLYERFKFQASAVKSQFPRLMSGLWMQSDQLDSHEVVEEVIKHGTLALRVVGLAECLVALTGKHHGESDEAKELGIEIIKILRQLVDEASEKYNLNFVIESKDDYEGKFVEKDRRDYGSINKITDKNFYTSGSDVPIEFECTLAERAKIATPYHELFNGGNSLPVSVSYYDLDESKAAEAIHIMHRYNLGCICFE